MAGTISKFSGKVSVKGANTPPCPIACAHSGLGQGAEDVNSPLIMQMRETGEEPNSFTISCNISAHLRDPTPSLKKACI